MRISTSISLSIVTAMLLASCADGGEQPAAEDENTATASPEKPIKSVEVKPVGEEDSIDAGLAVGSEAPLAAIFKTSDGDKTLESLLSDGPAILIFTRSVSWCPFCQTQLKSVNAIEDDLKSRGYQLFGVSYDSVEEQDRFSKNQMLDYKLLSDESSAAIDAFELRDPQYTEGRAVGVPYASVVVIAEDGKILTKNVSGDYKKRPTNDQILELLDAI